MSLMRRIDEARKGYATGDQALSARAHSPERISQAAREEHGSGAQQYLGEMVYGGLDGIITTFAVVSGVAGAQLGANIILVLGLANLLADGFSMATGAYLSSKSDQEYYERERERERWEVEHYPEGEKAELLEVYRNRGYDPADASALVEIHARHPDQWVETMMFDELGMVKDERKPTRSALATFIAFVIAGSVPLLVFLLGLLVPIPAQAAFWVSLVLSGVALFLLGAAKVLVTQRNLLRSGLETLLVGGLAAGVAYAVGALLRGLVG
jgi:VIT1/CCC1 family predicted Fe2+/Mn2+ transporter